jgi:hypothetical protein
LSQFVARNLTAAISHSIDALVQQLLPLPSLEHGEVGKTDGCNPSPENRVIRVVRAFRLVMVSKAVLLGRATGQAALILDRIRKGTSPLLAHFDFPYGGLAGARWNDTEISENAMEGFTADYFFQQMDDGRINKLANIVWSALDGATKGEALQFGRDLLEFYDSRIKSRRFSIRILSAEFPSLYVESGYHVIVRLPIFYDYILNDSSVACIDNQLGRFWVRRLKRGTDQRTYELMRHWVDEHPN